MKNQIHTKVLRAMAVSLTAATLFAASSATFADMDGGMVHHGGKNQHPARMAQIHARHLSELKAKLQLTEQQEPAWNSFADSMKPPAAATGKKAEWAAVQQLPTPERIDRMRALHKERMAAMEASMDKRAEATKTFYAALTPAQQKVFDAQHMQMMHAGKGHGEHRYKQHPDMPKQ
ncbi:MAG: Spy/CpxP family protein refolding chaperone [Rhodoferax sp.]|nr:Spy/CpxP family protein refolding chaperone [Rhodoferax sp.]